MLEATWEVEGLQRAILGRLLVRFPGQAPALPPPLCCVGLTPPPCPAPPSPTPPGLWLAPQMVGEALKGGRLAAQVLSREGFNVIPAPGPCNPWSFITGKRR